MVRNPSLEKMIGQTRMRCKHGPEESGGGDGGAAPPAKRAKLQDLNSMTHADLGAELEKAGLGRGLPKLATSSGMPAFPD